MTASLPALIRYQAALLVGSYRWLPPLLAYAAFLAIGVQTGGPILDAYGYAAGGLLPVSVWLARICATNEPPAARSCVAAAAGPGRAHLAALLAAVGAALVLALAGTAFVALLSDPHSTGHRVAVPVLPATGAGLLTALVCLLLGIGIGALCSPPVLRRPGWGVPVGLIAALLVLVLGASPANAALRGMITGSERGTVTVPWLSLAVAVPLASAATALACALSGRRG
ncbi:ABC transporter [Streptomyces noursei]|uniref:ABC transporter n=1 Tax=Streptomyces noursei TaxID=1971 RepID=UPI000C9C1CAA|nr:ABC transporter [Streptomyces noursei]